MGVKKKFASAVILASTFAAPALAQDTAAHPVGTQTTALQNKEAIVMYKYGKNIDPQKAQYAAEVLTGAGAPAKAVAGGLVANCVTLEVNGEEIGQYFEKDLDRKIGSAAWRAVDNNKFRKKHIGHCTDDLEMPLD